MNNKILYNDSKKITEEYTFEINTNTYSNHTLISSKGIIKIIFVNRKFDYCSFPMEGRYNRGDWEILSAIRNKIIDIENSYIKSNND